ncbi:hypothetical protein Glove_21g146 [Diversispora epigaea]|uniref:Uncharacterized protein n=1 Tax=Diversispora epigaea TaxID=1348612 RepID=A0A397JUI4_9GLOM|nr:hypothetical protein Glove_21g146 [Diversispora epigaea]
MSINENENFKTQLNIKEEKIKKDQFELVELRTENDRLKTEFRKLREEYVKLKNQL